MSDIFRDLIHSCRDRSPCGPGSEDNPLFDRDIAEIYESVGLSFPDFADHFAYRVATSYMAGEVTHETGDNAINALLHYSMIGPPREFLRGFAVLVFDAFDAGEYQHAGDINGEDLGEKHTRPVVRCLLETHQGPENSFKLMPLRGAG